MGDVCTPCTLLSYYYSPGEGMYMLKDQFSKNKNRDNLSHATSRALALGNDITAYGHSVQFVEETIHMYTNLSAIAPQRAIYPLEHMICKDGVCETNWKPRKQKLSEMFVNTEYNRRLFRLLYLKLRSYGKSRREIVDIIRNIKT
jgi:hypothetical protein